MVRLGGGVWERKPSETQVDYALPSGASDELVEYFRPLSSVIFAPDGIARIPEGRVFGAGIVLSADGQAIARDVSVDFGKPFQEHWLLGFDRIKPPVRLNGRTAVVATALARGYSHWLLDELPRWLLIRGLDYENLIAHTQPTFVRDALGDTPLTPTYIEPARYSHFQCEQLIVPSLIGQPGYPTGDTLRLMEEFTGDRGQADMVCGEKIYLSREKARRRRVVNEAELWPWLQARGFVKVCAEDLNWDQQIEVFRRAQVIVAPHGAGLANLVFCSSGTKVIELFARAYVNGCYWRLSAVAGLDYRPLVPEGSDPLRQDLPANSQDIRADLRAIEAALRH